MSDAYEKVTDRILKLLESGTVPWRKPWKAYLPVSLQTGQHYQGLNQLVLGCAPYAAPQWATFNTIRKLGGYVRKGEFGWPIVFWKFLTVKDNDGNETETVRPLLKYYHPVTDSVHLPKREHFDGEDNYYSTLFHELGHATGHPRRLNRGDEWANYFATAGYAKEELVAEMTAAMLCAELGIEQTLDNSAAYIQSWLKVLRNNVRLVVVAAGAAQKAANWIANRVEQPETAETYAAV